jgi:raffinose/stachyose/melibiose transport system permease protein
MATSTETRTPIPDRRRARPQLRMRRSIGRVPLWIAIPGVVLVLAFQFAAPLSAVWYAFTNWNGVSSAHWVGFANFSGIFSSALDRKALFNSLILAVGVLVLGNLIGLGLALGLNRTVKSRNLLRAVFFLPIVISPLASAYIWQYIFSYDGSFNGFLHKVGLGSAAQPWLGDPSYALWAVLIVLVWQFSGLAMIIYLAGLQGIPQELDEAATVDGASSWYRFRKVTLPLLAPAMTISMTLALIFGLRVFDQIIALTDGGPVGATETLATQVYEQTFTYGRFGYGAAFSLLLTVLVGVLAFAQLIVLRRREMRM